MMNHNLIPLATLLGAVLLVSCEAKKAAAPGPGSSAPPAPPSAEVVAALNAQPVGKRLLGNTQRLVGAGFVAADLQSAPELYIVHFSASW